MQFRDVQFSSLFEIPLRNGVYKSPQYLGRGVKFIRMKELFEKERIYASSKEFELIALSEKEKLLLLLKNDDLLFSRTSVKIEGVGKCSIVKEAFDAITYDSNMIRVRLNESRAIPSYYFYYFQSPQGRGKVRSLSSGTAVTTVTGTGISSLNVPYPSLSTQRTIASILSAYDDLIQDNTRRITILEEMAQMIYEEWFVKFRFPGHEQLELEVMPKDWETVRFFDIAEIMSGGTPKTTEPVYWNGSIPFYTPKDAPNSFFVTETEKSITEAGLKSCSSQLYPPNTIFITARGTVGRVALNAVDMAMNQSCYALKGRERISQLFVFLHIMNSIGELKQTANGAVFETIIVDTFKWLQVVKPPLALIDSFTTIVTPIFEQMLNLTYKNVNLRRTRDLLLPKLISGEIDVSSWSEDSAEEAAQELAASVIGSVGERQQHGGIARKVAEAGPIEPMEKDALEWHSLWEG